jgi:hypothetical protein
VNATSTNRADRAAILAKIDAIEFSADDNSRKKYLKKQKWLDIRRSAGGGTRPKENEGRR